MVAGFKSLVCEQPYLQLLKSLKLKPVGFVWCPSSATLRKDLGATIHDPMQNPHLGSLAPTLALLSQSYAYFHRSFNLVRRAVAFQRIF